MLEVQMARVSGFCGGDGQFGVSGAIRLAQEAAQADPGRVYLIGELVHNRHVTAWLKKSYGIKVVSSLAKVPSKSVVVVKAHGAPPAFFQEAQAKKITIVDATCPMVKAAQALVKQLVAAGKKIIYVSSAKNHDEAISVSQQTAHDLKVVTLAELDDLVIKQPTQTVVLTQTTLSILETRIKFEALQKRYPDLTIRPHLCQATTQRQQAVLDLASEVDFLLVVGAPHSSNSRRLLEVAQTTGKPAQVVDEVAEIQESWFTPTIFKVGVIAGASTPAWVTQAVIDKIKTLGGDLPASFAVLKPAAQQQVPPLFLTGLGHDSHRLQTAAAGEPLILAGLKFTCGLVTQANSDGDVILHALCNALATALGGGSFSTIADPMCQKGITDSREYLAVFLKQVQDRGYFVSNLAVNLEASQPKLETYSQALRQSLARLLQIPLERVGLALTSGEDLTACGRGEGIAVSVSVLLAHA